MKGENKMKTTKTQTEITQDMLVDIKTLRNAKRDLEAELKEKSRVIIEALQEGISVEDGLLRASLTEGSRRPKWKSIVERIKGKGYVNNVISHTKPGPPSLKVG
jgi:hypothetical protein